METNWRLPTDDRPSDVLDDRSSDDMMVVSMIVDRGHNIKTTVDTLPDIIHSLKSRKKAAPVSNTAQCYQCQTFFTFFLRRHHCRCCGQCFCDACTQHRIHIPEELILYEEAERWLVPGVVPQRCCLLCKQRIVEYKENQTIIQQWRLEGEELPTLFKCPLKDNVGHYLSEMRLIQYLLPDDAPSSPAIKFLQANRRILSSHSRWIAQLIKIGEFPDDTAPTSCSVALCGSGCYRSIDTPTFCATLPYLKEEHQLSSWCRQRLMITATDDDSTQLCLPLLLQCSYKLLTIFINNIAMTNNINLISDCYWLLNYFSEVSIPRHRHHYSELREMLLLHIDSKLSTAIIAFHQIVSEVVEVDPSTSSLTMTETLIIDPLMPSTFIKSDLSINILKSSSRPVAIDYSCSHNKRKSMLFKAENVMTDYIVMNIIKYLKNRIATIEPGLTEVIITYNVIPLSSNSGIIEMVQGCQTLATIVKQGTVSNFLARHNSKEPVGQIQHRYRLSLAFWTTLSLVLSIGDRHFDNIMIDNRGLLFHIDYSYLLGADPKFYAPAIRLNEYMMEGLGGDLEYHHFKECCLHYFLLFRRYIPFIYSSLAQLPNNIDLKVYLHQRLLIGYPDTDVKSLLYELIDNYRDSSLGYISQYMHDVSSVIKGLLERSMS